MQQNYQRQFKKQGSHKTLGYFILLIVLILFLATVGVRLLVNTSIFINDYVNKGKDNDTRQTSRLIGIPEIDNLPDATHSAQIEITVRNVRDTNFVVTVNDEDQKEIFSDKNAMSTEVDLDIGENTIYVTSTNPKTKESKKSSVYRIDLIEDKPKLEVTTPTEGTITDKQEITVSGNVGPDISVTVNSQPVVVSTNGAFTTSVKLVNGENKIIVEAENLAGVSETTTITVRYDP